MPLDPGLDYPILAMLIVGSFIAEPLGNEYMDAKEDYIK
jgi:hypothetical protein